MYLIVESVHMESRLSHKNKLLFFIIETENSSKMNQKYSLKLLSNYCKEKSFVKC